MKYSKTNLMGKKPEVVLKGKLDDITFEYGKLNKVVGVVFILLSYVNSAPLEKQNVSRLSTFISINFNEHKADAEMLK